MEQPINQDFAVPTVGVGFGAGIPTQGAPAVSPAPLPAVEETTQEKIARLRAKAAAQAAAEFNEDAVYARMLAEEREAQANKLAKTEDLPTNTNDLPPNYTRVKIFRGGDKQDLNYVPLGLNGLVFKVPRDEIVILPDVVVQECLEHAVEEITIQSYGGLITRPAHRFPFQTLGPATPAEYKAYQEQQRAKATRQLEQRAQSQ